MKTENNILLVANYAPGVGGISSHIDALAAQLKKEGKQVDIFSTKGGQLWRIARFVQLLFHARHYSIIHKNDHSFPERSCTSKLSTHFCR